jgi:hypothetical protein
VPIEEEEEEEEYLIRNTNSEILQNVSFYTQHFVIHSILCSFVTVTDKLSYPYTKESNICWEIPGLHFGVNEVFALLGCYAAYVNCCLPT